MENDKKTLIEIINNIKNDEIINYLLGFVSDFISEYDE